MTNTELKAQIDAQITNEIENFAVSTTDVGGNMKEVIDYVDQQDNDIKYFTIYKAKLAQSGIGNITATILKNNTGKTITYTRNSVGSYSMNFSSMFSDLTKVDIMLNLQQATYQCAISNIDNLNILATIETRYWNGTTFVLSDDIINRATIYLIVNN